MGETLHRLVYESTVDDAVDVALRLARMSQAFQKQIRQIWVRQLGMEMTFPWALCTSIP